MRYVVTTGPTEEPVSMEAAKLHLRTVTGDTTEDAAIIGPIITAAREYCENITGRAIARQTITALPGSWAEMSRLPRPPILQVNKLSWYGEDGTEHVISPEGYVVDDTGVGLVIPPPGPLRARQPISVEYQAGYDTCPMLVRQAMLLLIGHWYENREAVVVGSAASVDVSMTTKALLKQYKVWWF